MNSEVTPEAVLPTTLVPASILSTPTLSVVPAELGLLPPIRTMPVSR